MPPTLCCGGRQALTGTPPQFLLLGVGLQGDPTESKRNRNHRVSAGLFGGLSISADATGTGRSFTFRKNAVNATMVASITDTTAGQYSDTTHRDRVAVGDAIDFAVAGSVAFIPYAMGMAFWADVGTVGIIPSGNSGNPVTPCFAPLSGNRWQATESFAQQIIRAAGTASFFWANVVTAGAANGTLTTRKNGAAGNQTLTLVASTTGIFEDSTHTDTLAAGDSFYMSLTGTTADFYPGVYISYSTSTSEVIGPCAVSNAFSASTRFCSIVSGNESTAVTTESFSQTKMPIDGKFSRMRISVDTTSTMTSTWTRQLRINGANATQSVAVATTLTGLFEDSTHTDNFKAGDLICFSESGGTAGSILFTWSSMLFTPFTAPPPYKQPTRFFTRRF